MNRFVTHEAIASNLLNLNHCSAVGLTMPWQHHLTNTNRLLNLVVKRMEQDWVALPHKARKPWNPTQLETQSHFPYFVSLMYFWANTLYIVYSSDILWP